MRTTITLDDDVHQAALTLAKSSGRTLGKVVSELVRSRLQQPPTAFSTSADLPAFRVSDHARPIALEAVRRAWEEDV